MEENKQNEKKAVKENLSKKNKLTLMIVSLTLVGAMAFSLPSCGKSKSKSTTDVDKDGDNDKDGKYEINLDEEEKNDVFSGEDNDGKSNGSAETSKLTEGEDLTETKEGEEGYTEALQYVLNNSEYNSLIAKAKREASSAYHPTYSTNFDSVPFGFFEQKGFDVSALKNDTLANFGVPFFRKNEPNNLYVCASAETNAAQPYLTQYILKYKLTDKEAEEFKWLHREGYLQAFFMVDAYSKMKTPEIINECKITTRAYDGLTTSLSKNSVAKSLIDQQGLRSIIMLNFSQEEGKAQILLIGNTGSKTTTVSTALNVANISNGGRFIIEDANGAYDRSYGTGDYSLKYEDNSANCEFVTRYFKTSSYSNTQILQK